MFISYQWGKQKQISVLYRRLTELGYSCWMDIKQMGGGDSLYDKIDRGVRGSKLVISCVTKKYSLSANCRREVSLSDALKRPIIPLLLEDLKWPPEGPMGMVFTQLLYIDFIKPDVDIQNEWKCPQFDELIRQMKLHIQDKDTILDKMMEEIENQNEEETVPKPKTPEPKATEPNPQKLDNNEEELQSQPKPKETDRTARGDEPKTPRNSAACAIL